MVGVALTVALVTLLATGGSPVPDVPAAQAPPIRLTTVNWGSPVSLLDAAHPGWSHLAPLAGPTEITATMELRGLLVHSWVAHLDAPDAYGGQQPDDCRGSEEAAPTELSCVFDVPISSGSNPLTVTFSADGKVIGDARGAIRGGELSWDAGYEVLDATGAWSTIARDHAVSLPATARTAIRQVVTNTGTIPMRLDETGDAASCDTRILDPRDSVTCPLRGVRPAQSLAGDLRRELRVVDAVGGIAEFEIRGGLTTFAGTFSLSRATAVAGQAMVLRARGLPADQAFAVQYRLDDQATLLGTSITRTGSLDYGFVVPASSPGIVRLNVVHDGITVASLPFRITRVAEAPDAAAAPWGLLAIPLAVLVGLLVVWRVRRRRRRAAAAGAAGTAGSATAAPE
jgi:hypothetical protein